VASGEIFARRPVIAYFRATMERLRHGEDFAARRRDLSIPLNQCNKSVALVPGAVARPSQNWADAPPEFSSLVARRPDDGCGVRGD
jgi:hypothetical protein